MSNENVWENMREASSNFVKFSKIGDFIKGTLVDTRIIKSKIPGKENKLTTVFELMAHCGEFHDSESSVDEGGNKKVTIIEPAIIIKEGDYFLVGGKDEIEAGTNKVVNPGLTSQMRNVKKGQIVGFRFDSTKPSKTPGFAAAKIIKVLIGGMDPNYMGQTAADNIAPVEDTDDIPM